MFLLSPFSKCTVEIAGRSGGDAAPGTPRVLWLSSTVHFEKGESKNIHIEYESLYEFSFGGPSDDSNYSDDYFRYLLSTASTWKGPIQNGKVTRSEEHT